MEISPAVADIIPHILALQVAIKAIDTYMYDNARFDC